MGLFWECNSMQFNKMPKLKRLKGFSEYVKRLKHPQKNDSKKIGLKTDQIIIRKKTGKNYQYDIFFRTKNISERKKKLFELYQKLVGKFSGKFPKKTQQFLTNFFEEFFRTF